MNNIKHSATEKHCTKIRTKLKFTKSEQTGSYIGFVSQSPATNRYRGVRQDTDNPKKICVLSSDLTCEILTNVLYDVVLVPMHEANGFVVIEAVPHEFTATVETSYIKGVTYKVDVTFGNKIITFDPFQGTMKSVRDIGLCRSVLEKRVDIKNLMQVVEDFDTAANAILAQMLDDGIRSKNKPRKR